MKIVGYSDERLDSHVTVVTGANAGIGLETTRGLYLSGARVIMAVRSRDRGEEAKNKLEADAKKHKANVGTLDVMILDLASLASIRSFASSFKSRYSRLDVLINNAGLASANRRETEDGFETTFGVNHLGPFLLTLLLLDVLKKSAPSRIVNVASIGEKKGIIHWDNLQLKTNYKMFTAYCQSKLANVLFTRQLAVELEGTGVTAYCLHPGAIQTKLWNNMSTFARYITAPFRFFFLKSSFLGAQTSLYCAFSPEVANVSGRYYADCKEAQPSERARSDQDAARLWKVSCQLVGWEEGKMDGQNDGGRELEVS